MFNHIEKIEACIYINQKPEKTLELALNRNIVIGIIRKPE